MPRTTTNHWSNATGTYSKDNIPLLVTGQRDGKWDTDRVRMERHLKYSSLDQAMFPEKEPFGRMFNPLDVPILDILAVEGLRLAVSVEGDNDGASGQPRPGQDYA